LVKIGILSDSHKKIGRQQKAIDKLKDLKVDLLIHAGDLSKEENLISLKNSNIEYVSVFGNNDFSLLGLKDKYNIFNEPYYFTFKEINFKLMHIPNYLSRDSDVVIFGHTHNYQTNYIDNTLYINPGEICARNYPISSFVLLEIEKDRYHIYHYTRAIKTSIWNISQKSYIKKS
jgi:putative phosphoesterase